MFSSPPLLPVSLVLCSLGMVIALVSIDTRRPAEQEQAWRHIVETAAEQHQSDGAIRCGVLPLGADATEAVECIENARRHGQAFWVLSQAQGIDSEVWIMIRGEKGDLSAVYFDSYGWEERHEPSFSTFKGGCKSLVVGKLHRRADYEFYEPAISCVQE